VAQGVEFDLVLVSQTGQGITEQPLQSQALVRVKISQGIASA
jgi:hypothetical protein